MYKVLVLALWSCLIFPAAQAPAANYSPVDDAFSYPSAPRSYHSRGGMDNEFHRETLDDPRYALADGLLNATWGLLKRTLPTHEYESLQKEQRRWISEGRDRAARRYMDEMSETRAYARATMDRVDELTRRVGVIPKDGSYSNAYASFSTSVRGGRVHVTGSAYRRQNTCDYEASGKMGNGWIRMQHDDFDDFYVLFLPYGAEIFYKRGGSSQGCGVGVGFDGSYDRD
ncbi:MAG: DUF1311 domain-containing protein [Desulfovibrio sp.]|nr:DUF1311 domain-containing protein [Desulfovibrio sp.]